MSWRGELSGRGEDATAYACKGAVGGAEPTTVSTVDDLEHALEERLDTDHIIGLSLILAVLDLHGSEG
jgi:hypothetical protein